MADTVLVDELYCFKSLMKNFAYVLFVELDSSFVGLLRHCEEVVSSQVLLDENDPLFSGHVMVKSHQVFMIQWLHIFDLSEYLGWIGNLIFPEHFNGEFMRALSVFSQIDFAEGSFAKLLFERVILLDVRITDIFVSYEIRSTHLDVFYNFC